MNDIPGLGAETGSTIWIKSLVDGVAGMTIRAKRSEFSGASPFQKIEVFDTYSFGRILLLAGTIVLTERDEHIYNEMITHPALLMHSKPQRVCIIGGGDGGALRETLKHETVEKVTVCEIDSAVADTVQQYFPQLARGFSDDRTEVVIDDGASYLEATREQFDIIIVDSYDPGGPVQSLETSNFHQLVRGHLADSGIAVLQTDSPTIRPDSLRNAVANVSSLFASYRAYTCTIPSFPGSVCSFVVCGPSERIPEAFDASRFAKFSQRCNYYNHDVHRGAFLLPEHIRLITEA